MRTGLLLLLLIARVAWAAPGRFVIADVLVNGVTQRPVMISISGDGSILARREDVTLWNLDVRNAPAEMLQAIDHVRLTAMPGVVARFDGARLTIEAAEAAFQGTRLDLQTKSATLVDGGSGAYINYDFSTFAGRGMRAVSAAAFEGVVFADTLSFATSAVIADAPQGRQFVRYESSAHWDFPDRVQSLVAGDAVSRSGALARSFRFGGISYGTNFGTRPDVVTFPLPAIPGESRIPTSAELLINGQAHSKFDLAAGPFEISNVPAINGAGEIQLLTRDSLGRQQVLVVPYYVTPTLLRPGLVDAGFEIGKIREDFGLESFHYGRGFARGLLRRGITPWATLEAFAETDGLHHVVGGGVTAAVSNLAVASAAVALGEGRAAGASYSASLERASRGFSFGLRGKYASRQFIQLGDVGGLHYQFNANAGVSLGAIGNISVIHGLESRYEHGRFATTAIAYQKQLGKSLSLLANFSTSRIDGGIHHFGGLVLTMPLDALASASASSTRQDGKGEHVLDLRQNLPADEGWAARGRVTAADSHHSRIDAGMTWQNAFGQWSADASYAGGNENIRMGMSGSLVMAGGVTRAVRQLGDAFAVVSVPGYPGIDIFHENQRVAQTDASGYAVIPRLRPYESNAIILNTLKLSLSTELSMPRRQVTPARRAGVILQFKAAKTYGALVKVLKANGEPVPAGALLKVHGEAFPFAANGEAWVTGLESANDAAVEWLDQRCTVRIPLPDASKARPRIGPLTCIRAVK